MIKGKGAKLKGARLERKVAQMIRSKLGIEAKRMPLSGAWEHLKTDIYSPEFPFAVEVKNQEKMQFWQWWEQAQEQAKQKTPLLVHSSNHRPVMVSMRFEDFLNLVKEVNELWKDRI